MSDDFSADDYEVAPTTTDVASGIFQGAELPQTAGRGVPTQEDTVPLRIPSPPTEPAPSAETTFVPYQLQQGVAYPATSIGQFTPTAPAIPNEGGHMLGVAFLSVAAGTYVGYRYGGNVFGGLAGGVGGAALVNVVRAVLYYREATPESKKEALVSGFYAAVGLAGAAYLWYKVAAGSSKGRSVEDDEYRVRRAGP